MLDVGIVGAGPVGLGMAALLLRRGLDVAVFEKRSSPGAQSRAIGIHPPALAVLETVGAAAPLIGSGVLIRGGTAYSAGRKVGSLDFGLPGAEYPFILSVPQPRTLEVLEERVAALGSGVVHRGVDVLEAVPDDGGLVLRGSRTGAAGPAEPFEARCRFLVAADGAHSAFRAALGIPPKVRTYPDNYLMGDFHDGTPYGAEAVLFLEAPGIVECFPLPGGIRRWVVRTSRPVAEPSGRVLADLIRERTGAVVEPSSNSMLSAFGVRSRLAPAMVHGRTVLVGDAAHELSPIGGQGMNLGWLDAAALAPLLERMVRADRGRRDPALGRDLAAVEHARLRAARKASRQAGLNMALGRPLPPAVLALRNSVVGRAVRRPAVAGFVARRFTMH
ncbi:FAD-dependent oxidoreductase [Arthrobacter cupressi]|uniref:2-polyprenyl-6-methoxyphenol hydroxylase n=1 Tax=Arthrobacter cupressi TaxID=1045773 RepID=A0A1G8WRC2_9MICC|nr:NAD(P)/FAD-dependent oxidoreductase [Arthrobacter cupressi]NYD79879.1 2-polyprenyl-6-methoxyphenol hydroxylase-like FAD-dependent oxidoreductase [Arthrobacter cupressi]SDJ80932.1 2-polyprenyl-6-methoxyphenol hydroxylase [Arthrobacter cupressi]